MKNIVMTEKLRRLMAANNVSSLKDPTATRGELEDAMLELAQNQADIEDAIVELAELIESEVG